MMRPFFFHFFYTFSWLITVSTSAAVMAEENSAKAPLVRFETSLGSILIETFPKEAPISVQNFLDYTKSGFYNGVIFHRVIDNFVVQGGGFDQSYQQKPTKAPIVNESHNGLQNLRGTLSMARTNDPNSATSQFFINLRHNENLDFMGQPGYAVFGKVVEGMEVVDQMATLPQGAHQGVFANAPNTPVIIYKASVIDGASVAPLKQVQTSPLKNNNISPDNTSKKSN